MTRRLANLSLRGKLMLITMVVSISALLLASSILYVRRQLTVRREMLYAASIDADMVGHNSTAALSLMNRDDAADDLSALQADSEVDAAWLFTTDGKFFAGYHRDDIVPPPPAHEVSEAATVWHDNNVQIYRPIMLGNDMLGTVCIQRSLRGIWSEQVRYLSLLGAIVLAASLVALLMVWRLEQFITRPILNLIETAKAVSADKDYGLRATPHADDELGQLVRCFNEMLMEIQQRDLVLQAHRDRLEDLVALRTEELVEVNRDLTKARDQAERASDAKSAFLANMSHEIRTPMTAILGYSDLLVEQRQSPSDQRDAFQVIRRNARHLLDLINDILDISKIEAGKMNVERIPVDLPSLIGEVVSIMRPRAIDKGLEMHVEFAGEIPRCIQCDPLRLKQILVNLIGNAVKFTHNGNITLFTRCEALANDSRLIFEIRDTGIGMTGEQMGRLFQPFTQADESTTRKFGGTGLGLAISQRLTRLLGGEISVASRPGEGSTFTVVIAGGSLAGVEMLRDLRESMLISTAPEPAPRNVTLNAKILLIEDGFDNQQLISTHLRKAGAEVTIAENGRIGLEKAMAQRFHLILMDMQMPEMDGQTATGELRRRGVGVPIIALTAHAMAEDRARCLAAGCTDYLSKPVRKDVLLNTVGGYLDGRRAYFNADAPALAPSLGRLRSSLASDPDMRDVLKGFVENLPKRVQRLMDLTQKRDLEQLREVLHQLKGAGGGYGFAEITRRAACAEKAIKAQAAIGNITTEIESLVEVLKGVEGYEEAGKTG